jgi:flagellar operon protein
MNHIKAGRIYYPQPLKSIVPKQKEQSVSQSFDSVFREKLANIKADITFSHHALQRLERRGITLDDTEIAKLAEAVEKARAKGAKESLILMNNIAYVVSVKNNKVITAVDSASMQDNVFTNIDSAVIL